MLSKSEKRGKKRKCVVTNALNPFLMSIRRQQMLKSSKYPGEGRAGPVVVSPVVGNTPCVV